MHYVVQENTFKEVHYDKLINSFEKLKLTYEIVKVRPFIDTFDYQTNRKDVFVFGALKLADMARKLDWVPGAIVGPNHDFTVYSQYYGDNLLNYDSKIYKFGDEIPFTSNFLFFRPVLDSKVFTGQVFNQFEWKIKQYDLLNNGHVTSLTKDTLIQVSTSKWIDKEIRFWVVDGKIVTGSQYRLGNRNVLDDRIDLDAIIFAQEMVDIYQLDKSFVMDVCLTDAGYKIVECGSISCAGFYKSDVQKTIIALEKCYS